MTNPTFYRRMPDDFRRDYFDLRCLIEHGQFLEDETGEHFSARLSVGHAEAAQARLEATPRNTIYIQTSHGRVDIFVNDDGAIVLTALGADNPITIKTLDRNQVKISLG